MSMKFLPLIAQVNGTLPEVPKSWSDASLNALFAAVMLVMLAGFFAYLKHRDNRETTEREKASQAAAKAQEQCEQTIGRLVAEHAGVCKRFADHDDTVREEFTQALQEQRREMYSMFGRVMPDPKKFGDLGS